MVKEKPAPPSDADIDQLQAFTDRLVEAHLAAGLSPQDLQLRIVHRKRKNDAVKAKAAQPALNLQPDKPGQPTDTHNLALAALIAEFRKPVTERERVEAAAGMDQLLIAFQEDLEAGDFEDAVHSAFRVARKAWAGNFTHLGLDPDPAKWSADVKKNFGME